MYYLGFICFRLKKYEPCLDRNYNAGWEATHQGLNNMFVCRILVLKDEEGVDEVIGARLEVHC